MPDISPTAVPEKESKDPITWGPIVAVFITVVIYFLSQFLGGLVIVLVGRSQGLRHAELIAWTNEVWPQFFYIALIEGLTVGVLWLFLRYYKAGFKVLGLVKPKLVDLAWALCGFAVYFPALIAAMAGIKAWFPRLNLDQQQQIGFTGAHGAALIIVFISLVVLPPLTEEILVRGFLFSGLKKAMPVAWAGVVTSLIFASAHLQAGSGAPLLWTAAVDTFLLSLVLVWLRQKTGSLWAGIVLHMIKNSIAFTSLFIFKAR